LIESVAQKKIKLLYVLDEDVASWPLAKEALKNLDALIVQSSNDNATTAMASLVLAASAPAEVEGTFTNYKGYVQLLAPAVATQENESRAGMRKSRLDKSGTKFDRWASAEKRNSLPHWKVLQGVARQTGANWQFASAEEIFEEMSQKIPDLAGLSYEVLENTNGAFVTSKQFQKQQAV
jgi:predicted molibdopterin-dependent oxidoreductase YjgC